MNPNNQKEFFENIALDANGNIIIVINTKNGDASKAINQYNFFKNITLTDDGYLNVYEG